MKRTDTDILVVLAAISMALTPFVVLFLMAFYIS